MTFFRIQTNLLILLTSSLFTLNSHAAAIAQSPLFLSEGAPPIVMLTMGKEHKLYYEAYNDASDLDDDGLLDTTYKPTTIDYFGYFDSFKCYDYASNLFTPVSAAGTDKQCSGNWSGDFLNYITTSRMDALRKVFYGGYRSSDGTSQTILKRSFIPRDAHSWGKEYTSVAHDGYDISDYADLDLPDSGKRHLFANVSLSASGQPLMRVLNDSAFRVWEWLSIERPVADSKCNNSSGSRVNCVQGTSVITNYSVNTKVCVDGLLEANCKAYSDGNTITYKPIGVLQRYGDDESMDFGLLTGSFGRNISGGVLRKNISSFQDEVDPDTGKFTNINGIVSTLDKLRIVGFNYSNNSYDSGWITTRAINEGEAADWGNPVAEMMYETLRYFAGKASPTDEFSLNVSTNKYEKAATSGNPKGLGLPHPTWLDPYRDNGGYSSCAKPIQMVISDLNPSFDSDQLPGSYFDSSFSGDLAGMNVSTLANVIWAGESEDSMAFIGQSGTNSDGTPSAKAVTSFATIRGLAPEEPTKQGSYYAASVALYGQQQDMHSAAGEQNVDTLAVALASPLPRIQIPVLGKIVTLVPFAKSVGGSGISAAQSAFQPTNQIVDFYVEKIVNTGTGNMDSSVNGGRPYGKFRINYEDVEQAADHDMDAIVEYQFSVNAINEITINLDSSYAAGGIKHHIGYVISGTTADGTYLEVRDKDTSAGGDPDYFLDTHPGELPGSGITTVNTDPLPLTASRTFTVGSSVSASFIKHDPLWYAAKWSMPDENNNNQLDTDEWDSDGDGTPDGYFLVTNAGKLDEQLNNAFAEIISRVSSSSAVSANSARLDTNTKIYQARFNSTTWSGQLLAHDLDDDDGSVGEIAWDAATLIPTENSRKIYSYDPLASTDDKGIIFEYANLNDDQKALLNLDTAGNIDGLAEKRADYIRGDTTNEQLNSGPFRTRASLMGDIVNSDPWYSGPSDDFGYSALGGAEGTSYLTFRDAKRTRTPALYFGANDGMLHAINANDGKELFTYIPDSLINKLNKLTSANYGCTGNSTCIPHTYFVDGPPRAADAYFDNAWHTALVGTLGGGGQGLFALDVTNPDASSFNASKVLWEISTEQSPKTTDLTKFKNNLGHTFAQASIVRMQNGKWAAIVSNGYQSVNQTAVLFIIDIETGHIIRSFDTKLGGGAKPNGLSTPVAVDEDNDKIVDSIYAGDLQGRLWKIDVSDESPINWGFAFGSAAVPAPLFIAEDADNNVQPITAKPEVGLHPDGGLMVYFGTGQYYVEGDQDIATSPGIQAFYAIRDQGSAVNKTQLQAQTILYEKSFASLGFSVRVTSKNTVNYPSQQGWYMNLVSPPPTGETDSIIKGERVVTHPRLENGHIIFITLIPNSDPCSAGGTSWVMEMDAVSGQPLANAPYDINGDGEFNDSDLIATDTNGDGVIDADDDPASTSGINLHGAGIISGYANVNGDKHVGGTVGGIETIEGEISDPNGRQSWRQLR